MKTLSAGIFFGGVLFSFLLAGQARSQSLQSICDPASGSYDRIQCRRELAWKEEMFKCISGGQQAAIQRQGTQTPIPAAIQEQIEKLCRNEFVPEELRNRGF